MPVDGNALWNFLGPFILTLARIGALFAFLPWPGWRTAPDLARMLVVLALTLSLTPLRTPMAPPSGIAALVLWLLGEAAFGLFVGLVVSFVSEGLLLAIQAISLQAGYSFATTFDPNSQADSGVLQTFLTIGTNLLFFLTGLHHTAIRAFASSLEKWPGGSVPAHGLATAIADFGSEAFRSGLRLALPVAGFLLFADLFLAIAGRLQAQLQLLSIAFPVKMLVALVSLMALMPVMVFLYQVMGAKAARLLEAALR